MHKLDKPANSVILKEKKKYIILFNINLVLENIITYQEIFYPEELFNGCLILSLRIRKAKHVELFTNLCFMFKIFKL